VKALKLALVLTLPALVAQHPVDAAAANEVTVAAVQFNGAEPGRIDASCPDEDAACALRVLIRRAAARGAKLIVTPEYVMQGPEPDPTVGEVVADGKLATLGELAAELQVYLVVNLITERSASALNAASPAGVDRFNAQVAFGPEGTVVAKHHKFELYAGEGVDLTAGTRVNSFDTPFGTVGLLICADLYGDPTFHQRLMDRGTSIVVVSSRWTVDDATRWPAAFARDWSVFVVAANASSGEGRGGGVFDRQGKVVAMGSADDAGSVVATIAP
jgi:predicted amidohydrolase